MLRHKSPGLLQRILAALGTALKRAILGRSTHGYMKQFTGGDEYWDRVIAAQLGWPAPQRPQPEPDGLRSSDKADIRAEQNARNTARRPPEPEYEPVHGWTKHQLDDQLTRNPWYRSIYKAELRKRCAAAAPCLTG